MINLKQFYDAAQAAGAAVTKIANEINALFEAGETEKALALRPKLDELKAKQKDADQMYVSMSASAQGGEDPKGKFMPVGDAAPQEPPKEMKDVLKSREYFNKFFDALKMGVTTRTLHNGQHRPEDFRILLDVLSGDGTTSTAGDQGGFLLPTDFDNKIHELQRGMVSLADYVNVENVQAYSGWRAVEKAVPAAAYGALTPQVSDEIDAAESPLFAKVEYTLADYAGYWPISNDLLSDTPVNVMNYLAKWAARKEVLTLNTLILALIDAITTPGNIALASLEDALRAALNTGLDPAISVAATIFTDQTGFNLLDQLEDGQGRPMLQPDVTQPTLMRYKGRPVVRLSDALWGLQSSRAPFAVGWGQEYCTLFRKESMQFDSTNIGGNSWRYNNTECRAILRAVAKEIDAGAMVLLKVATA
jgi:HK97 family phage major capsid protein